MAHNQLTIDLPRSSEALRGVLQVLMQYGLISEQKARTIQEERRAAEPVKVSRWAQVAEEMSAQGYLKGKSDELIESSQTFRDNFEIQDPFHQPESRQADSEIFSPHW